MSEREGQVLIRVFISEDDRAALEAITKSSGVPMSVLLRRLISALRGYSESGGRLDREFDLAEHVEGKR